MKLLYAEDELAMSEAVTDILEYHNYSVDAVYDGADALAYAREGHYDGIILDVMMPKMDGFAVLKAIRESGDKTPVLLLTAKQKSKTGLPAWISERMTICPSLLPWESFLPECAPCCGDGRTLHRMC